MNHNHHIISFRESLAQAWDIYRASSNLTTGMLGKLSGSFTLLALLNPFGAMWLVLGLLVTIPVSVLTMASLYRYLT